MQNSGLVLDVFTTQVSAFAKIHNTHKHVQKQKKPIRLTIFAKFAKNRERAVATGLLARSSWKLDISEAHVFLRMHKDDVQNALMKNALDVSCSSTLAYFFSTTNFQVKVSKKLILLLWFLGSLFDNTTSELLTTQCRKVQFYWNSVVKSSVV